MLVFSLILAGFILALGLWLLLGDSDSVKPVLSDLALDPATAKLTWTLDTDGATLTDFEVLIEPGGRRELTYVPSLDLSNQLDANTTYTFKVTARFDDADDVSTELTVTTGTSGNTELTVTTGTSGNTEGTVPTGTNGNTGIGGPDTSQGSSQASEGEESTDVDDTVDESSSPSFVQNLYQYFHSVVNGTISYTNAHAQQIQAQALQQSSPPSSPQSSSPSSPQVTDCIGPAARFYFSSGDTLFLTEYGYRNKDTCLIDLDCGVDFSSRGDRVIHKCNSNKCTFSYDLDDNRGTNKTSCENIRYRISDTD
jgi:hypothetical protein